MKKVPLLFEWRKCSADMGEYRQQSQIFEPCGMFVVVELEAISEYFHNPEIREYAQNQRLAELGQGDTPKLPMLEYYHLTMKGAQEAKRLLQENLTEDETETQTEDDYKW